MRQQLEEILYGALSSVLPSFNEEAETESYPFAVFSLDYETLYTKDGPYAVKAECVIDVVADSFDVANDRFRNGIKAVGEALSGAGYMYRLDSDSKSCTEGIWVITTTFNISKTI